MPPSSSTDQIQRIVSLPAFPPVVLALCPHSVRLSRLKEHLLKTAAGKNNAAQESPAETTTIQCTDLTKQAWKSLRQELSALSLFSSGSFIVLEKVEKLGVEIVREIVEVAPSIPPSTHLFLFGASLSATSPLLKYCRANHVLIELEALTGPALKKWTQKELKTYGGFTQGDAIVTDMLIELGEESPDKIAALTELLSLYAGGTTVKARDVRGLFPDRTHPNEFQIADALTRGDLKTMAQELVRSLQSGKSPLSLLGLIARNLNILASIKSLQNQGMPDSRIRERLGIPEWLFRKHAAAARHMDMAQARHVAAALLRADSQFKNYSLGDDAVLLELFHSVQSR